MLSILITKTPPGFADKHIRDQWVGVVIPLAPEEEAKQAARSKGWSSSQSEGGYIVRGSDAVSALQSAGKNEAASFWSRPAPPSHLRFPRDCCERIA